MAQTSIPLDQWPVLRTGSRELAEQTLASVYGARKFDAPSSRTPFYAHGNYKPLKGISLSYCSYTTPVSIEFPASSFFRKSYLLRGSGAWKFSGRHVPMSARDAPIIPAEMPLIAQHGEHFETLLMRIDESALNAKAGALNGTPISQRLEFFSIEPANGREAGLERLVAFLVNEASAASDALPSVALVELEQSVLLTLLWVHPNNYSRLLEARPRDPAPWQVKRAEEFIEANWNKPLTVEAIADATGVSARSIFLAFRRARGYSPMNFVRALRLRHAQRMLMSATPRTTVTAVALECGFQNVGHFAVNYRRQFGESPSETLKRGKAQL